MAACTLTPTAGDDVYVCDSGTSPGLTDLSGNNSLTMPANGSGIIQGDVVFDAGTDRIEINANGVIDGDVEQGSEADVFVMNGGRILRSEEHTSELQSLMRISYAVFCLKKKKQLQNTNQNTEDVHTIKSILHHKALAQQITRQR